MLIFTIIAILIIFFLWFNTSVFDYKRMSNYWDVDKLSERRLPFTVWRIIGLALLLIPWWNICIFMTYLGWYLKRVAPPDECRKCIIYRLNVKKYSPFLYSTIKSIGNILNKRIV